MVRLHKNYSGEVIHLYSLYLSGIATNSKTKKAGVEKTRPIVPIPGLVHDGKPGTSLVSLTFPDEPRKTTTIPTVAGIVSISEISNKLLRH